jgi:hypothetical protein
MECSSEWVFEPDHGLWPQLSYCCRLHPVSGRCPYKTTRRAHANVFSNFPILVFQRGCSCEPSIYRKRCSSCVSNRHGRGINHGPCGAIRAKMSLASRTRSFSLCGGELETALLLVPTDRFFERHSRRLYGVGGSSLLGGIGTDAIVKSSTNLQNSVSLNFRMLEYAATMRSARTRAWRSP